MTNQSSHGMSDTTPCWGKAALFESTEILDHLEAKKLCDTACNFVDVCRDRAALAQRLAHATYGPEGTWHGQLYRAGKVSKSAKDEIRRMAEDALYSDDEARQCAALYYDQDKRTPWVVIGKRVYERRTHANRVDREAS